MNQRRCAGALAVRNAAPTRWWAVKTILAGIAAAATLGVMSGAAMQPDLELGARPAGPQFYAGGLERVAGPFEDGPLEVRPVMLASGKIPDHVYGTDWTRLNEPPREAINPARPVFVTYNDAPEDLPPAEVAQAPTRYEPGDAPAEAFAPASAEEQAAAPEESEDLG